jgi:hypothetical protein
MKCPNCNSQMVQGVMAGGCLSCNCSVTQEPAVAKVSTMSDRKPAVVSRDFLAIILEDMAERVRRGDCFGGGIEFHYWEEDSGAKQGEYSALGAYRIGNLEGQGGMRLIENGFDLKSVSWVAGGPSNLF